MSRTPARLDWRRLQERLAIQNVPFMGKLAAAPLLAVAFLVVLAIIMRGASQRQVARLDGVVNGELASVTRLSTAASYLREANGQLYALATNVAAKSGGKVADGIAVVMGSVDSSMAILKQYAEQRASGAARARLDSAVAELKKYRDAVEFVGSMLEMDFNSAVMFINPFQENYRSLNALIDEVVVTNVASSQAAAAAARAASAASIRNMLLLVLVSVAAVIALTYLLARATVRSIRDIAGATRSLAEGNLGIALDGLQREDELGDISRSLVTFKASAQENIRLQEDQRRAEEARREQERRAAEEQRAREVELEAAARAKRRQEMLALSDEFERSVLQVADVVTAAAGEMETYANRMSAEASSARQKSETATDVSRQALSHTQTVAGAAQQLYASVQEITAQVNRSTALARNAVGEATAVNQRVRGLAETAEKVTGVVNVITTIANQTKLLALNATIESGIAGEAGKGFAVVASEVKALANQTAKATDEISEQIAAMQAATHQAQEAILQILRVMTTIEEHVSSIAASVKEQDSATEEIARTVEALSGQATHVTETIAGMKESTETTGQVASHVLEAAQKLNRQSGTLKDQVQRLLTDLRAA